MKNDRPALHCGKAQQVMTETMKRSCPLWKREPESSVDHPRLSQRSARPGQFSSDVSSSMWPRLTDEMIATLHHAVFKLRLSFQYCTLCRTA